MNPWNCPDVISTVLTKLSLVGPPRKEDDGLSVLHGLSAAINCLREPTQQQLSKMESSGQAVKNRGRIILLTNIKNPSQMEKLEGYVQEEITQLNMTETSDL
ncbi:protein asunder [Elysia marginata]|uniref:Protein asunder n=1 Tax=Elysia marginata TaxID=1093978 RepID=A0AAV4JG40_9GAST|nr:protein asunder [Elysia marginata]